MVSKLGRVGLDEALLACPRDAEFLAPIPWAPASAALSEKIGPMFSTFRGKRDDARKIRMLDAQSLWDATMAKSISSQLEADSKRRVLHLCGRFHCEHWLGIPEHLGHYLPTGGLSKGSTRLVVCISSEGAFGESSLSDADIISGGYLNGIADFVVLCEAPPANDQGQ